MKKTDFITLIHKRLTGQLSSTEQQLFENWSAKEEYQLLVEEYATIWEKSENYTSSFQPNIAQAKGRFLDRLSEEKKTPVSSQKVIPLYRRSWLQIAAAIALLLGGAFIIRQYSATPVEWVSISTAIDEKKSVLLSDGSMIYLNENTNLEYPISFQGEREVNLKGEAFFDIARDEINSFIVSTNRAKVTVLGTSFNVDASDETITQVDVSTGKVQFQSSKDDENVLILKKGDRGVLNHLEKTLDYSRPTNPNAAAWHSHKLSFNNTPLKDVIADIEEYYNVKITYNERLANCGFTSLFVDKNQASILKNIEESFSMQLERLDATTIRMKGGICQ